MDYLTGTRNYNISMGTAFENFQTGPLLNYLSNLKSGDWCLGNVGYVSSTDNSLPLTIQELKDKQNNSSSFYYDTYVRLYGKSLKEPTLKSIATNINKFGDNTDMYVGTLAADEAVYAGGKIYSSVTSDNIYYYLKNKNQQSNKLSYFTLSPNVFVDNVDSVFIINEIGQIRNNGVASSYSFRPAITLLFSTKISNGNGTLSNPYEIAS